MMRLLTATVLILMVTGLATAQDAKPDSNQEKKKADQSPVAFAIKGTPDIDGEVDESWKKAKKVSVSKPAPGLLQINEADMATGTVRLMWDDEHLYALWQVKDKNLSASAADDWAQDSVELFLDENNKKTPYYQFDDAQYRVNFEGKLSGQGEGFFAESLKAAAKKTKKGYTVEMAIKVNETPLKAGDKLGLELQINDDPGDGLRGAVAKWNHIEDDSWEDTSNFGTLELK